MTDGEIAEFLLQDGILPEKVHDMLIKNRKYAA